MKCLNCGEELKEGIKFCTNCGVTVQDSSVNNAVENGVVENNVIGPSIKTIDETNINNQNNGNIMNMNTVNTTNNSNNSDNKGIKKRSKTPLIIISCIVLLGIIVCLLYLFVFNKKSSKQVFVDGFKSVTSELFKDDNSSKKSIKNNISFNIQASGTGVDSMFDIYNNIKINSDIEMDATTKRLDEEILINYKGNDLLGFGIYGRDDSVYLGFTGMYDKYIKLPITKEQYNSLFSSSKSLNSLKEALDSAFEASLDDKYFTKSSKSIDVNGKNKKYNAYTFTITNDNIKDIIKRFADNLLSNDNVVSMLSSNLKVDKSMVKELASTIDYSNIYLTSPIEITIYTSGLKETYKGIEVKISESGNQYALRYIKIDNNNSELVFDAGITSLKFTINETGSDNNKKTTISTDLGIIKADLVTDTIMSDTVKFKDIDTTNVIEYEEFITNSNDILNHTLENNKALIDFITEISGKMNMSNNSLNYNLLY